MKKHILIIFLFSLIWIGCEKDSSTLITVEDEISLTENENSDIDNNVTLRSNQPRPFKGTIVYDTVSISPLVCNCTNGVTVQLQGNGNISHLGLVSSPATYCVQFGAAPGCPAEGSLVTEECLYIIAANGDEVHLNVVTPYESCIIGCCITGSIQGTFDGGTGRFTDATGSWSADFNQQLGSSISEVTVDGQIVY